MQLQPLADRVVLISGASRGLGRAMAMSFARYRARLVLCARGADLLKQAAEEARSLGAEVADQAADVSATTDVGAVVGLAMARFGRVDVLINNAAVATSNVPLEQLSADDWDVAMQANVRGPFLMSRAVIPHMRKQRWGRIINVTSALSMMREPNFSAYTVTKAALNALTRVLAAELAGSGVLVNGLDPGAFQSRMNAEVKHGPEVAVSDALFLASLPNDGPSGRFYRGGIELGW